MEKAIAILFFFCSLFLISLASAEVPTCTDSDGNGAYQTKGSVTLTYSNGTTEIKTDFCEGSTTVDYYCSGTYTGSPSVLVDMKIGKGGYVPSGCSCQDGACTGPTSPTPSSYPNCPVNVFLDSSIDNTECLCAGNLPPFNRGWCCSASTASAGSWVSPTFGATCQYAPTSTPTPSPTATSTTPGAGAPEPPNDESGVWAQVEIATNQIVDISICTKSVCGINGEYHGYVPPASYSTGSVWWPTSKRYIWQLQGQAGYSSGTFNFNTYVFTVQGGTIYSGKFTTSTSTSGGGNTTGNNTSTPTSSPAQSNATTTPIPTPTSPSNPTNITGSGNNTGGPRNAQTSVSPTPHSQKPAISCQTDQDCAWLIANGCPESAGASWGCSSLRNPASTSKSDICPQVLSQKPSANCGCIQNTCAVFEKEKPKEPHKKIGNTNIDSASLLGIVIQIEQLKIKFDFLQSATEKLANYYNLTNKPIQAEKWSRASEMLGDTIQKLDSLKEGIRNKLSAFTLEDLKNLKKEIKSVIETIREVVKTVL